MNLLLERHLEANLEIGLQKNESMYEFQDRKLSLLTGILRALYYNTMSSLILNYFDFVLEDTIYFATYNIKQRIKAGDVKTMRSN